MSVSRIMRYGIFGIPLAFVGLPLYVHVPRFYAATRHVGLTDLGLLLLILRLADTVIDPLIGALSDRFCHYRRLIMIVCIPVLACGYFLLFSPPTLQATQVLIWLAACLLTVYITFSTLMINYYAIGVDMAASYDENTRIAAWREGSMLLGVLLASLLPSILAIHYTINESYRLFALLHSPLLFICGFVTLSSVPVLAAKAHSMKESFKGLFASRLVRWALLIAFCNAIPTAITSTLFLFFTADVLQAPEQSGIMLAVYFLSAACAMPLWTCISAKRGKRTGLLIAMLMAIGCFIWAWFLGAGDTIAFYIICALSGMTLGADAALLPALFADVLSNMRTLGATAFGMWNFTSKLTMALAAGIALPTLALGGYEAGAHNAPHSLHMLSFCYALLPCMFKALAIVLLYISPLDRHSRVIRVVK